MKFHIDVDKAIKLLNKRSTTVEDLCKFLYEDINEYQERRQDFYVEQFKNSHQGCSAEEIDDIAEEVTNRIIDKIEQDVHSFTVKYADTSIDAVLDAINEKKFKNETSSSNLLVLLCSLKQINEEI